MADDKRKRPVGAPVKGPASRELRRVGCWAAGAACAMTLAVAAAWSEEGARRYDGAVLQIRHIAEAALHAASGEAASAHAESEPIPEQLAEIVREFVADRERLAARLTSVERGLEDLTSSIANASVRSSGPTERPEVEMVAAASPNGIPPTPSIAPTVAIPPTSTSTVATIVGVVPSADIALAMPTTPETSAPASVATAAPPVTSSPETDTHRDITTASIPTAPQAKPDVAPPKPEYGIELGSAADLQGLRALWVQARSRQSVLQHLRPHTVRRQTPQGTRFKLVAGPLVSRAEAARVCTTLIAAGLPCQPTVLDGQRLAGRP